MVNILECCSEFLRETVAAHNCVKYSQLVCRYALDLNLVCDTNENSILDHVNTIILDIYNQEEHRDLPYELLKNIAGNDDLSVSELTLYHIIEDWLQSDPDHDIHSYELMKYMRFTLIPLEELKKLQNSSFAQIHPAVWDEMQQAMNILSLPVSERIKLDLPQEKVRGRLCICAFGGYYPEEHSPDGQRMHSVSFQVLQCPKNSKSDFKMSEWVRMPDAPCTFQGSAVATMKGLIFVCGGYEDKETGICTTDCFLFDPILWRWERIAPLCTPRADFTLVVAGGSLYAIGGVDSWDHDFQMASIERYSMEVDAWLQFTTLPVPTMPILNVAATEMNGLIYVLIGPDVLDVFSPIILPHLWSLDIVYGRWEYIPVSHNIIYDKHELHMITVANIICLIPSSSPRNMSCYKPLTGKWHVFSELESCSEFEHGAFFAYEEKIYCLGCQKSSREPGTCFCVAPILDEVDDDGEDIGNSYCEITGLPRLKDNILYPHCAVVTIPNATVLEAQQKTEKW